MQPQFREILPPRPTGRVDQGAPLIFIDAPACLNLNATTNPITGSPYAYDANGNMTNDGLNSLAYDAEKSSAGQQRQ